MLLVPAVASGNDQHCQIIENVPKTMELGQDEMICTEYLARAPS